MENWSFLRPNTLLKAIPHVNDWWENLCEENFAKEFGMFRDKPIWESFIYAIKKQYYPIKNYDS